MEPEHPADPDPKTGFDEAVVSELARRAKAALRKRARALRQAVPESTLRLRSAAIVAKLQELEVMVAARSIALFSPMLERHEVDLRQLDGWARARAMRVFYPLVDRGNRSLSFRDPGDVSGLEDRGLGILEPAPSAPEAERIDVIVVPALAADARGYRLGYGAGFYDGALPRHCPPACAVAVLFHFQLAAELPTAPHDFAVDWLVTDQAIMLCDRS